jgi:hypothetical protein
MGLTKKSCLYKDSFFDLYQIDFIHHHPLQLRVKRNLP